MINTDRREFLKKALISGFAVTLSGSLLKLFANDTVEKLTILHTNDTHSRIEPFAANDPSYPGMGGFSRQAALISNTRKQTGNFLLLDAGDIFQGTPYFNLYGGEPELKLMTKMGYDAATMGNHEFDNGLDGFLKVLHYAEFPFVTSNYDFSETILKGKTVYIGQAGYAGVRIGRMDVYLNKNNQQLLVENNTTKISKNQVAKNFFMN